jgi:glutamate synthase (NADPH/NADH)
MLTFSFLRGINEGRQAAREVDLYLEKCTNLPVTGGIVKRTAEEVFAAAAAAPAPVEPVAA